MPLRVGLLSVAHVHTGSYVHALSAHPDAELVGVWEDPPEAGETFSQRTGIPFVGFLDDLLAEVDAVVVCSENNRHAGIIAKAAAAGKHILCEKPLVAREADAKIVSDAVTKAGVKLMTAFPCRFSPAFQRLRARVKNGDIGPVRAICATNRGRCPFGWFVQPELSGGGAMIDHVVHVTDLMRNLLEEEPVRVQAQIGSNLYGQEWDDTAMVTIEFPNGVFATLDSSWSRPQSFRTWGDVTMTVVGDRGTIELDMFGQGVGFTKADPASFSLAGYGSDFDKLMVDGFVRACLDDTPVPVTMHDGFQAARVAMAGYESAKTGQPVSLA